MVHLSTISSFAAVVALAAAAAVPLNHVLHEKRDDPSAFWQKRDRVARDALLPMRIGLKQGNLHTLYDKLMEVSDPASTNYAKHWTQDEVHAHFAPADETVAAVRQWLADFGISHYRVVHSDNKGWLALDVTGQEIEDLLKTEFYEHDHTLKSGKMAVGCDEYHVPAHIQEHIDYITPGVKHTGMKKTTMEKRQASGDLADSGLPGRGKPYISRPPVGITNLATSNSDLTNCSQMVTPQCVAALYGIPEPGNTAEAGNQMAVFEEGDYYSNEDLNLFFAKYAPNIPQGTQPVLKSIDGGYAPVNLSEAGGESNLDLQLAYPIIYPQKLWVYQVDDINYATGVLPSKGFGNTFLDALDGSYCTYKNYGETGDSSLDPQYPDNTPGGYNGSLMCGVYRPASVISISYGEQENQLPANYQKRQCDEFGKLGLQGVTITCASGDSGVSAPHLLSKEYGGCITKNGTHAFSPTNPNSCPFLTNVGATMIPIGGTVNDKESAAWETYGSAQRESLFTSSGGFSNVYPAPPYQETHINNYLKQNPPPFPSYNGSANIGQNGGVYNRLGHGIPDVAAIGQNIVLSLGGEFVLEGGTSASSPVFAAIITRINEERLLIGKKTVGFINPALYSNPSMLNDITNGSNPGCGTVGFTAAKGWDPVTGLGTPNFPKMLDYFISLP